jgi:translation initiation factor IF-2
MSSIKVHELAKDLNMTSKDMLDKITAMGIDAKSHMSVLSDMDVIAIKNTVLRGKSGAETKIVKVAPKKTETVQNKEEVKVVVKAAAHPSVSPEIRNTKPAAKPQTQPQTQPRKTPGTGQTQNNQQHAAQPTDRPSQNTAAPRPSQPQQRPAQNQQSQQRTEHNGQQSQQRPAQNSQSQQRPEHNGQQSQQRSAQNSQSQQRPAQNSQQAQRGGNPQQQQRTQGGQPYQQRSGQNTQQEQYRNTQGTQPAHQQRTEGNRPAGEKPAFRQDHRDSQPKSQPQSQDAKPNKFENKSQYSQRQQKFQQPGTGGEPQKPGQPQSGQQKPGYQQPGQQKPGYQQKRNDKILPPKPAQQKPKPQPKPAPKPVEPEINLADLPPGTKIINVPITVAGFADQIEKSTSQVIMALMKLGIMANINQNIDEDTVVILGAELGVNIVVGKVEEVIVEEGLELFKDKDEDLKSRPPIITVMGHVDHGKTSLLDAIRKTNVTASESGGITQHIGASEVYLNGQKIVFLDTPGHEAFTAMRARGAHVTDIAVLVVAADDSVKPQTVEAISHAKAANVPIIVAINKMDKPGADLTRVKQDLTEHGILIEEWGGDTICVPVSAKTREGIDTLLEMILLQAEVQELKANPNRLAMGSVIEARLDKTRGPVATLLVLNGTLQSGMSIVAGTSSGRIKAMTNYKGDAIRKAGPATAVEILGLTEVPEAGDEFNAVKEDKVAREIAENRRSKLREEVMARNSSITLEQLFSQIQEGEVKELNLIIKGDVQGSVGALTQSLEKLKNENVKVKIIHTGVGTVTESDIMLANTAGAIVIAFNVRPSSAITAMAEREKVEIRTYRVIYDVIDEVEAAMKGMLDPVFKEVVMGKIEIRNTFKVPGAGIIGGAYVLEGKVQRNAEVRLVRDGIVIHEGKISSLKRFKDDVKEVAHGYECGIGIENYNDIKEGDIIEAFKMEEIERK